MAPTRKAFDATKYLETCDDFAELLTETMATGDRAYITSTLGVIARGRGMRLVAKDAGVTREALYKSLSVDGDPKLSTLLGVMKALGVKLVVQPVDVVSQPSQGGTCDRYLQNQVITAPPERRGEIA